MWATLLSTAEKGESRITMGAVLYTHLRKINFYKTLLWFSLWSPCKTNSLPLSTRHQHTSENERIKKWHVFIHYNFHFLKLMLLKFIKNFPFANFCELAIWKHFKILLQITSFNCLIKPLLFKWSTKQYVVPHYSKRMLNEYWITHLPKNNYNLTH